MKGLSLDLSMSSVALHGFHCRTVFRKSHLFYFADIATGERLWTINTHGTMTSKRNMLEKEARRRGLSEFGLLEFDQSLC
jgi:hypothetical protein